MTEDNQNIYESIGELKGKVELILTNHLPHMQDTIDALNKKFWAIVLLLLSNLVAAVIYLIKW